MLYDPPGPKRKNLLITQMATSIDNLGQAILTCSFDLQGKKNPGTDEQSVKSFLKQVLEAKEMKIDK